MRSTLEFRVRDLLAQDLPGRFGVRLVETEHPFPGGRIDILGRDAGARVALEVKARRYGTNAACAQLLNYLNYVDGWVGFVAPKVRRGVHTTLQQQYRRGRLRLYEYDRTLRVRQVAPEELDDRRPWPDLTHLEGSVAQDLLAYTLTLAIPKTPLRDLLLRSVDAAFAPR